MTEENKNITKELQVLLTRTVKTNILLYSILWRFGIMRAEKAEDDKMPDDIFSLLKAMDIEIGKIQDSVDLLNKFI